MTLYRVYPDQNSECPNGPLANGDWPCLRGPRDECLTCGWQPPREENRWVALAKFLIERVRTAAQGTSVRTW